jgi:hypothetical protein
MGIKKTLKNTWLFTLLLLPIVLLVGLFFATTMKTANTVYALSFVPPAVLSEMTENECIEFITDNEIEVPESFTDTAILGSFVQNIISRVEATPDLIFTFSHDETLFFAENIRTLVNDYYNVRLNRSSSTPTRGSYYLQDNWVQDSSGNWVSNGGAWDSSWYNYNCYAYAIGQTENVPPRTLFHFSYQPGYWAGTGSFTSSISVYNLALVVKDDLEYLGYHGVSVSSTEPTNLNPSQSLICIRRGPTDYHFMKKNFGDGYWYHKPGSTAPLKYKHHPAYKNWETEYSLCMGMKAMVERYIIVRFIT